MMNTTIGKSFGLALLMAIGVVVTMLALGMFSVKPASAGFTMPTGTVSPADAKVLATDGHGLGVSGASVVILPTKARSIAQYTIGVTGNLGDGMEAINVGGTITVTFNTSTTVPSSIAASAVKLKASIVDGGGADNQLVSAEAITVSGRTVTITVPDMDSASGTGDNGIAADGGVTVTFTQAAGIQNADLAKSTYTVDLSTSVDATVRTSKSYSVTSFVDLSSTGKARGVTIDITGGGFADDCTDCKIRFNPQNSVEPTTGAGGVSSNGSGTIDGNGVFVGTITLVSGTNVSDNYVWVTDSTGTSVVSTKTFTQKAGATPRSFSASPGSTVTVDLVDYTDDSDSIIANEDATLSNISGTKLLNKAPSSGTNFTISSSGTGNTSSLLPYKFQVPTTTSIGTHVVTIKESGGTGSKSATFSLEVVGRVLTVTPATAAPGQSITISGTGFKKDSTFLADTIVAKSANGSADINHTDAVSIDATGAFSFATTLPTLELFADTSDTAITITATDQDLVAGSSTTSFSKTSRTLTLSPTAAGPGTSVTVSVTGMTVDNGEVSGVNAEFTISAKDSSDVDLKFAGTVTFPIGSDGSGSGTITVPTSADPKTYTFKATDNAIALNIDPGKTAATSNRTATASFEVPTGTITVTPASASTGNTVTVTGVAFPPNTTGSALTFGGSSGVPVGGFLTDGDGNFSVITEVPAATTGGSLTPGTTIVEATIGTVTGNTTGFSIPNPAITLTPAEAAVEETVVITGTGFDSLGTATVLTIGTASAMPDPKPRAARNGDITATITVPLLNPGAYTVVLTNADGFTATATFKALASKAVPAAATDATETIFADVIANADNLVRVWRFSNADQSWAFYDPRPAFAAANTLTKSGAGDIVWVNVLIEQEFQGATLFPGWNLISLK